jgi:hypothetical protein
METKIEYYYEGFKVELIGEMPTAGVAQIQSPRLQNGQVFSVGMAQLDRREIAVEQDGEQQVEEVPPSQSQIKDRKK